MKQKTTHGLKKVLYKKQIQGKSMFLCPDSVRIYAKEFQGHDSLGIAIFDHATSMGEYAFDQCAIIRTLYCSLLTIIPNLGYLIALTCGTLILTMLLKSKTMRLPNQASKNVTFHLPPLWVIACLNHVQT